MEQQINHPTAMADLPDRSSAMDDTTISHHHTGSRVAMPLKVTAPRTAGSSPSQDRFTAAPGHESVPTGDGPYLEVSLIIPARNEEHRLRSCIEAYWRTFETRYETRFEIIVVTNGCIDNTVAIANEAARTRPNLRVHDIPHAAGKGAAVLRLPAGTRRPPPLRGRRRGDVRRVTPRTRCGAGAVRHRDRFASSPRERGPAAAIYPASPLRRAVPRRRAFPVRSPLPGYPVWCESAPAWAGIGTGRVRAGVALGVRCGSFAHGARARPAHRRAARHLGERRQFRPADTPHGV